LIEDQPDVSEPEVQPPISLPEVSSFSQSFRYGVLLPLHGSC
jgi:hypothetical protein